MPSKPDPNWWQDNPSTGPIKVENGIKARRTRGKIATSWWSQRFITVLEELQLGGRMSRGKNYARAGQVMSLNISSGKVIAKVQGSRPQPYTVKLISKPLTGEQWDKVTEKLASKALFAAKLLAGEMPPEIEEVFAELDVPLFPAAARDLPMHCSCPDWAVPCKHVAAVCFLLGERFDDDPFLIFEWRGRSKSELLGKLRKNRVEEAPDHPAPELNLENFFTVGTLPPEPEPQDADLVLLRVDAPAIEVGGEPLIDVLTPLYQRFQRPDDIPQE
ncbi:SWIM zinc finger family protein [Kibdelosporangium philippinense]|uniref:SWIM zinc finger family protein n=1 Tax=Kibdelosporangium philippinense TaxID=211113 RepID=A0ABS8ZTW2_9PSEU|nr:SWIM zinc finger family protein [Kibdelosporangium philippinense]MCE7011153.1 SWIM zinc finger family protein [Kibdelosporangium philippinense]